ncbi:MAG: acetyl-CoA carboxylase carboxyltransferase subunit beta [Kiritimatiellae bacterium]|nr:acetyl-CoA carboxylase carboxyltransferase subunit beta [Kiritimatiellia bacterium]
MAWFTKASEAPLRVPTEALWNVCKKCGAYTPKDEYNANLKVCPTCGAHGRLSARERIELLADKDTFKELASEVIANDPLTFSDASGAYAEKVKATREKTKIGESIVVGTAKLDKIPVVLGAMDFRFMGGSLGSGTGERILQAAEAARKLKCPLILCTASGGARMQEGIVSLMQMAKTCAAIQRLRDEGLLYISVMTDPTTGGVSASYAMVGDLNIAEPKTLIGFAGRRVIETTIKQKLPPEFQTSEYLLEHGFLDKIVARKDLKTFLAKTIRLLTAAK